MISKRLLLISEILLKRNTYITIDTIAASIGVSNKTIRNDLIVLDKFLNEYNLLLDKKTGSGVIILGSDDMKLNLLSSLKFKLQSITAYSPEDRKIFILKKILSSNTNTRINDLSSSLHTSYATIYKDLVCVENWLKQYNISILKEQHRGLKVIGKEKNIRKAILDLIFESNDYNYFEDLIYCKPMEVCTFPPIKQFDDILTQDFNALKKILLYFRELHLHKLSDESLLYLLIQISISISRISNNKFIELTSRTHNHFKSKPKYHFVEKIYKEISTSYDIYYSEFEISYMYMLLLSHNIYCNFDEEITYDNIESGYIPSSHDMAISIVKEWQNLMDVPLVKDEMLVKSLTLHLASAIYRLRFGFSINNPILEDIKLTYPNTFLIAQSASNVINEFIDCIVSESEIGYLATHLVAAIERYKKKLRTLLISHSSVGISKLLYNQIKNEFHELDIVSYESLAFLNHDALKDIDLVISTIPINKPLNCSIVVVNSILRKEDFIRLSPLIKKLYSNKNSRIYPF